MSCEGFIVNVHARRQTPCLTSHCILQASNLHRILSGCAQDHLLLTRDRNTSPMRSWNQHEVKPFWRVLRHVLMLPELTCRGAMEMLQYLRPSQGSSPSRGCRRGPSQPQGVTSWHLSVPSLLASFPPRQLLPFSPCSATPQPQG